MEIIKTAEEIKQQICRLGRDISAAYAGKPLTLLVVMNGGLFFAADLAREITLEDFFIDSICAGSYRHHTSTGKVELRSVLKLDPAGRHVLILDEVLDTGHTLKTISDALLRQGAVSVRTVVLVEKICPAPAVWNTPTGQGSIWMTVI